MCFFISIFTYYVTSDLKYTKEYDLYSSQSYSLSFQYDIDAWVVSTSLFWRWLRYFLKLEFADCLDFVKMLLVVGKFNMQNVPKWFENIALKNCRDDCIEFHTKVSFFRAKLVYCWRWQPASFLLVFFPGIIRWHCQVGEHRT